jgi:hypothetical protein
MNSSGIKRGLATTAITALAVTGIPFLATSASANPINDQVTAVTLLSQYSQAASLKSDGTDATIRLEAAAPAAVTSVTFQFRISDAAPWQDIAAVSRNDDGAFSAEWAAAGAVGGNVDIRVINTAEVSNATPAAGSQDQVDDVDINGPGAPVTTVNLPTGSALGVFQSPYGAGNQNVAVGGTTSSVDTAQNVTVEVLTGAAAGNSVTAPVQVARDAATGTFAGVLDIRGYAYGSSDQLVLGASLGSDDVEAYTLYKQAITTVTAAAVATTVPIGDETDVVVTVSDQNQQPIAGARVSHSDGTLVGLTDAHGQVTTAQGGGTEFYYADATAANGYNVAAGDKRSADVTVTEFAPAPSKLVATSSDGAAFDLDENDADDITVQVKDQNNGNLDVTGQSLEYYWVVTPFDGTPVTVRPLPIPTETAGEFVVPLPPNGSGTYELFAALNPDGLGNNAIASSKVATVKAGQAEVTFDQDGESAQAGSREVVDGQLVLEDGTGLTGRNVELNYTQGTDGSDGQADAGLVPVAPATALVSSLTVITAANGSFSVTVEDKSETPQGTELGGFISANTVPTPDVGDALASGDVDVDFTSDVPPSGTTVVLSTNGGSKPGQATQSVATVTAPDDTNDTDPATAGVQGDGGAARDVVAGQRVTLTVDKGFFTTGQEKTPSVVGADAANLVSLGQTITRTTDPLGVVRFQTAIERDAGFDDDGKVKAVVTAAAGSASDTVDVDFDSSAPLNGGEVEIVLSPVSEQNGAVDPAPADSEVFYDVYTTDQFGNRVGGGDVDLEYGADSDDFPYDYSDVQVKSDFDDNGDFSVTGNADGALEVTGVWEPDTLTYVDVVGNTTTSQERLTDTVTQSFYEIDFAASTFTITSSPEGTVPSGTTVTETVKMVDQEGNPVRNMGVQFFRTGPDAGGGDANVTRSTNANGEAFYTFIGSQAGTATIAAQITDGTSNKTLTDKVVFAAATPPASPPATLSPITAKLIGASNGAKADGVKVFAPTKAAGAVVRLFRVVNGRRIQVGATRKLNAAGNASFTVMDRNGSRFTKYVAVIKKSVDTQSDTTNAKRVR